MPEITALGEALIDLTQTDKGYRAYPGGAPANLLAMLAKLGHSTAFLGKVGDDQFGHLIRQSMEQAGIGTKGLIGSSTFNTTLALVHLSPQGDRSFTFYRTGCADVNLTWPEVRTDLIEGSRHFHFGSVSLTDEPVQSATLKAAQLAKKLGLTISFDPNYRKLLWPGPQAARDAILGALPLADIIKVSWEELLLLSGTADIEEGARELLSRGPSVILVSLAEQGAFYLTASTSGLILAPPVKAIDTTGAGDAFFGAFLSRFLKSGAPLFSLDPAMLQQWVSFAVCAGTLSVLKAGAIPSLPEEKAILELVGRLEAGSDKG